MNIKVSKDRLMALVKFLRKLPRKRFNYASWVGDDWRGKQDLSCGTTACALGWAATMPKFRKLGLRLRRDGDMGYVSDAFGTEDPYRTAANIFGISVHDAKYLFTPVSPLESALRRWDLCQQRQIGSVLDVTDPRPEPRSSAPYATATAKVVAKHIERYVKKYHKLSPATTATATTAPTPTQTTPYTDVPS